MPLKVIGAGFGRTGTLSLKLALEQLGFGRCYHMAEAFNIPSAPHDWIKAAAGEAVDWNEVFRGFDATVDFPASIFYRQLAEFYPDAKLILTLREPESWFASTLATIANPRNGEFLKPFPAMAEMSVKVMEAGGFGGPISDH